MSYNFINSLLNKKPVVCSEETIKDKFNNNQKTIRVNEYKRIKSDFIIVKDNVNKINLSAKDFYSKINQKSNKNLLKQCLINLLQKEETIQSKIQNRKFMFGKNKNSVNEKISNLEIKNNHIKIIWKEMKNKSISKIFINNLKEQWKKYLISLIISNDKDANLEDKILKADFHGAYIEIISSKIKNQIGIKGTVLVDNKNSLIIVTDDQKKKLIIKNNSIFKIPLQDKEYKIYGSALTYRTEEKIKHKVNPNHLYNQCNKLINLS